MTQYVTLSVALIITAALLFFSYRALVKKKWGAITVGIFLSIPSITATTFIASTIMDESTIERLTREHTIATIQFTQINKHHYQANFTQSHQEPFSLDIYGDQWQIDARVMKWNGAAAKMGLQPVYRFERISGRYDNIRNELSGKRSVHALNDKTQLESIWDYMIKYHEYIPWLDSQYGSATYMPMKNGAVFTINLSQSGLISRPRNFEARQSIKQWL